jgi:hypothetical protein
MYKRLTEEETSFMECFYQPKSAVECLFAEGTARNWNDNGRCIDLRIYQLPFLGFDSILEDDNKLSDLENFRRRINVGTRIILSGRKIGKSFVGLIANILIKLIHYSNKEMTMGSYDEKRISKILDPVSEFITNHKFFKSYKMRVRKGNPYEIKLNNGNILTGINETIKGKNPGENYWSHHPFINFQDEVQSETEQAYEKRVDAASDFGVMDILCGITLISKMSPLGRILRDRENKNRIIRLPQYVTKLFDEKAKQNRIRAYGGEQSTGFRINVAADLIENAQGVFDMDRLKTNLNKKRIIKRFEITKSNFNNYKRILVLEPVYGATKTFVTSDVGDSAATEITVFGKVNGKYQLVYNITTFRLSLTKELPELMEYIFRQVQGTYLAVDATIMGKPVYEILADRLNEKTIDDQGNIKEIIKRVYWVAFNEDVITGIEKDDNGRIVRNRNGEIQNKTESALHFSVVRLQSLFYDKKFDIPEDDYKFELQFSSYIGILSGSRMVYDSTTEDHYVQSFEVFALLEWYTEQLPNINNVSERKKTSFGVYS